MSKKYNIGILIIAIIIIYLISDYLITNKNTPQNNVKAEEKVVSVNTFDADSYYLFEVNGYIVVYLNDKKTPYEYTDIRFEELPEDLRNEIRNGKYLKNTEELYGFLENYTS